MMIRKLDTSDWQIYRKIRLEALKNNKKFLATRYENEIEKSCADWQKEITNPNSIIFGYFIDDKLVAISALQLMNFTKIYSDEYVIDTTLGHMDINQNLWYLTRVYNKPEYRGIGVMDKFMNYIIDFYKANAFDSTLYLIVHAENISAIKLYERLDFKKSPNKLPQRLMGDDIWYDEDLMVLKI